jgi:hypothetical protein
MHDVSGESKLRERFAKFRDQLRFESRAIESCRFFGLDPVSRTALYEQAFYAPQRRQLVVTGC